VIRDACPSISSFLISPLFVSLCSILWRPSCPCDAVDLDEFRLSNENGRVLVGDSRRVSFDLFFSDLSSVRVFVFNSLATVLPVRRGRHRRPSIDIAVESTVFDLGTVFRSWDVEALAPIIVRAICGRRTRRIAVASASRIEVAATDALADGSCAA
jgi:hypothetical protein